MDLYAMIRHYKKLFNNDQDIFDWVCHDMRHMGLTLTEYADEVSKLREHLNLELTDEIK